MTETTETPRPIRASASVQRQVREQRTVNSLLSGVALTLISGILLVASLAGFGGYVLWKQLQDQSATVALYEQNTKQRFFEMESDLIRRDTELARNLEQANLRQMNLSAQFEEYRSSTNEALAETSRSISQLRTAKTSLERQLSEARQENESQREQLAKLSFRYR